jgi:membrane-bound lytic murein transglycosylase D
MILIKRAFFIVIFLCPALLGGCKSVFTPSQTNQIPDQTPHQIINSNPHVLLLDPKLGLSTGNLWHNLVANFHIPLNTQHPQVQAQIQWFAKNPDYLTRTTQRATPYMYLIHEQIQNKNLPSEVALLPMIESAYYPFSYSGAGAAGLWQLMPGTASDLGVKRNRWYDGRKDIFVSTH